MLPFRVPLDVFLADVTALSGLDEPESTGLVPDTVRSQLVQYTQASERNGKRYVVR